MLDHYLAVHLLGQVPVFPDVYFWRNWTSNLGVSWAELVIDLWGFHYENSISRLKVFGERREGVLWVCRSSRQMEGSHFQATRRSDLWFRGHWVAKTARICGGALCYSSVAAGVCACADSSHASQSSSSGAASENHDIPCRRCPVMSSHISGSRSSSCSSDSGSKRHRRLDLQSGWPNPRSCCCMRCNYRCNCCR